VTDRHAWLRERRRAAEERMDTIWAPIYDDEWGASIDPTHRSFVERLVDRLPPGGRILDAASPSATDTTTCSAGPSAELAPPASSPAAPPVAGQPADQPADGHGSEDLSKASAASHRSSWCCGDWAA
jgi:hypothetical protein